MALDIENTMTSLREVADTFLKGSAAEVKAARRDLQQYIAELEPEVEVALTELAAAAEEDRQTWIDTLVSQVDAVTLRTLRRAKSISRALEKRIRDTTLAVLLTAVRLAA